MNDQKSKFGFAGQVKAGVSYDVTPEVKLYAGARYFGSFGAHFDKDTAAASKTRGNSKFFTALLVQKLE